MRGVAWVFLGAALTVAAAATSAKPPDGGMSSAEKAALMRHARGSFDMSRSPRPFVAFMILDQKENPFPSFWCGRNLEGTIKFGGESDMLDESLKLGQTGSFTLQFSHTARKYGMSGVLPGGDWIEGLKERNFRVVFETFDDPTSVGSGQGGGLVAAGAQTVLEAGCAGRVRVGEKSAPFKGTARLVFTQADTTFALRATFSFPGKELGLEGAKGEAMTATLYTGSVPVTSGPGLDGKGPAMPAPGTGATDPAELLPGE
jgi:hypothetical protein